jgi:hypothetical protein
MHDNWRKSEFIRLKYHEDVANDMWTGYGLVEVPPLLSNTNNVASAVFILGVTSPHARASN